MRRPTLHNNSIVRVGALGIAVALFAGCSGDASLPDPVVAQAATTEAPETPAQPECSADQQQVNPVTSYEPTEALPAPGAMPAGSTMETIQQRGRLIVGVSGDTVQFGARNPITGEIEGFDIDILKEVAIAIFGDADPGRIEFRIITYAQRLPSLESGAVDLVAHTMTINCNRWLRIGFSTEYFAAGQKVLVKRDSKATSIDALAAAGARVCVPGGSTNLEALQAPEYDGVQIVEKADITDCLVAFQQGEADAITADDTVLVGFAAQDPYAEVVGEQFTSEPYGIGVKKDQVDLVEFVNSVLDEIRTNGRWDEIYAKWVGGDPVDPPVALYGRTPPG
jgi:polar amino acid transport system substrate-binding protein